MIYMGMYIQDIDEDPVLDRKKKRIKVRRNMRTLDVKNIIFIESAGRYLTIHLIEENIRIRGRLSEFISDMEDSFLHVHQSYAVNMRYIKNFGTRAVSLKDGTLIPISRGKQQIAREKMIQYLRRFLLL